MSSFFVLSLFLLTISRALEKTSKESAENNPGLDTSPDKAATESYFVQHTMLRIKDPKASLDFYSRIMGMSLLKRLDFTGQNFTIYAMGYENTTGAPSNPLKRTSWAYNGQKAVVELTHVWGTETNSSFPGYHNGNTEPLGYGHIAIRVDDIQKAIKRFQNLGVKFARTPEDGNAAFIQDPDSYWIEILDIATVIQAANATNAA